jgi:hypothetical protein
MKKFIITSVLLGFIIQANSQYNTQLIDSTKIWSTLDYWSWMPSMHITYYHKFCGDSIIGQYQYIKILESLDELHLNWYYKGLIRSDSNGYIYMRNNNDIEGLCYRFDVNAGDLIEFTNPFSYNICATEVISVDTVLVEPGNQLRKRITLAPMNQWANEEYWVEGIGSLAGILNSGFHVLPITGGGNDLLCQWDDDELLYSSPDYDFCYSTTVSVSDNMGQKINISVCPNPMTNQSVLSFEGITGSNFKLEITDMCGKLLQQYEVSQSTRININTSILKSGSYLLILKEGNNIITRNKLIVQ